MTSAGTAVQVSNVPDRLLWIRIISRSANTGAMYVGTSTVSSTNGEALFASEKMELFPGSIPDSNGTPNTISFSALYVDAAVSGGDIEWVALVV